MKRTVEEYMALPYTVELTPDDGSCFAKIKELEGCMTVGDNPAEALEMLDDAKEGWFATAIEDGLEIPLPESMREVKQSGKVALRMPKSLHRQLVEMAEAEGVSLNQHIVALLSEKNALEGVKRMLIAQRVSHEPAASQEIEADTWAVTNTVPSCKVLSFELRKPQVIGI
jgi:antitoxin HicB